MLGWFQSVRGLMGFIGYCRDASVGQIGEIIGPRSNQNACRFPIPVARLMRLEKSSYLVGTVEDGLFTNAF